jgi:hypothetical protein
LLADIYAAIDRKMPSNDQSSSSDRLNNEIDDDDDDNARRGGTNQIQGRNRQALFNKNQLDAEEIDDNLDYGQVDD